MQLCCFQLINAFLKNQRRQNVLRDFMGIWFDSTAFVSCTAIKIEIIAIALLSFQWVWIQKSTCNLLYPPDLSVLSHFCFQLDFKKTNKQNNEKTTPKNPKAKGSVNLASNGRRLPNFPYLSRDPFYSFHRSLDPFNNPAVAHAGTYVQLNVHNGKLKREEKQEKGTKEGKDSGQMWWWGAGRFMWAV